MSLDAFEPEVAAWATIAYAEPGFEEVSLSAYGTAFGATPKKDAPRMFLD
jgi:hypothetical protein